MDKLPKRMTMGNVPVWFGIWSSMVMIMIMVMVMVMVMDKTVGYIIQI